MIKAVTFDVGGTLIEPKPSVGHVYAEVAAQHGVRGLSPEVLSQRFRAAWRARAAFNYCEAGWAELVDETFHGLTDAPPSTTFFSRLYRRFAEPDAWRIFEDVWPALDDLASHDIRLAVISNWDERLRALMDRLGLSEYFETLVISCEVGFTKPSPVIFEQAAMRLGLPPSAIAHVGDSFEMDVQGARRAGFQGWQLERDGGNLEEHQIESLLNLRAKLGAGLSAG